MLEKILFASSTSFECEWDRSYGIHYHSVSMTEQKGTSALDCPWSIAFQGVSQSIEFAANNRGGKALVE